MGDIVILCMSSTVGNNFDSWALSAELGRHVLSLTLTFVVCDDHLTKPKMRLKQRVLSGAPRCIPRRMYRRQTESLLSARLPCHMDVDVNCRIVVIT